jgi:hypothetical protein
VVAPGRYLLGACIGLVVLGAALLGAVVLRRRLLPESGGAPARLAEAILWLGIVLGVSEVLGLVGLFRLVPVAIAFAIVGLVSWRALRAQPAAEPGRRAPAAGSYPRWQLAVAFAACALVVAEWMPPTIDAFRQGITNTDSVWYHLPVAARFVQLGSIAHVHYIDNASVTAFYPASSELLHALGIMVAHSDVLSVVINLGWLALAFLAAWCLGRPFGVAPVTLVACALVLGTSELVSDEAGGAYNDIAGLALVLSALALLAEDGIRGRLRPGALGLAALAAGLAAGVKYTFLFPVAALTVCVLLLVPRGMRLRRAGLWLLATVLGGGVWYARNLFATGNPVPQVHAGPLPGPPLVDHEKSAAHYLGDGAVWKHVFFPGLHEAFGRAWIPLLALAGLGLVLGLIAPGRQPADRARPLTRTIAVVALVSFVGYLFTPQPEPNGQPTLFVYDVRFMAPAVVLGLVLLPIVLPRRRAMPYALLGAYGGMLLATQFSVGIWTRGPFTNSKPSPFFGPVSFGTGIAAGAALAVVGAVVLLAAGRREAWRLTPVRLGAGALVLAVLLGGYAVERSYLRERYRKPLYVTAVGSAPPQLATWADSVHHARIAIANFILQYPLYGNDLSNRVQTIGVHEGHGAYPAPQTCLAWRHALDAEAYDHVVAAQPPNGPPDPRYAPHPDAWTASDPSASLVQRAATLAFTGTERFDVFALRGRPDASGCG